MKMTWYHGKDTQEPTFICQLNGSMGKEIFTTWNETDTKRYNLKDFYDTQIAVNGTMGFYNFSPEYQDCNKKVMQPISYRRYPCESYLANYSIDHLKGNLTQSACAEIYDHEIPKCYQFLKKVDLSWTHNEPVTYVYFFNLSEVNKTIGNSNLSYQYTPHKPIESLYCSLLNFFGVEC